jgi:hypothetical protein
LSFIIQEQNKREGIITYSKKNGIIALEKHVDANHVVLVKRIEEKVKSPLKNVLEKQLAKKKPNMSNSKISKFFWCKRSFKKDVVQQKQFLQDLALSTIKNHLLI